MNNSEQYLTYDEYQALGGTLDETSFDLLEFEARKIIDERTQKRLLKVDEIPEDVKTCIFVMIGTLKTGIEESAISKNIASEKVGEHSVTYVTGSELIEVIKTKRAELDYQLLTYLTDVVVNGVSILYCGVI